MRIYGKEVDFKISRIKDAENFENALKEMRAKEECIGKYNGPLSGLVGMCIGMFRGFFVKATGVDVLEECEDMEEAKKAYFDFLEEVKKQKAAILDITAADIK